MTPSVQQVVDAATREWQHWGDSVWDLIRAKDRIGSKDDDPTFAQYVIDNYCSVGGGSPTIVDIQDDRYYWSAVGMSAIMKAAGFVRQTFPFSQSHSTFIRHFIKARRDRDASAPLWGFRAGEAGSEPDIGDLVAYARGKGMTAKKAAALFDSTSSYESHTDVVVARRPRELDVIGCNVRDSVTMKTLLLDSNGHISDTTHLWFAVLKRTDSLG